MSLKNKVAIVTGGKQGIGLGIAKVLAKHGCRVVVSDLDQEGCDKAVSELVSAGAEAFGIKCDVSNKADVDALIDKTIAKYDQLDI